MEEEEEDDEGRTEVWREEEVEAGEGKEERKKGGLEVEVKKEVEVTKEEKVEDEERRKDL